jgi:quinol-cytochrome oxidoreductase complex cytochrome b subunit
MNDQRAMSSIWIRSWGWIQERVDLEGLTATLLHAEIPEGVRTYFLGGTTLFFLGVQVLTGILLALYYRPSPENAYPSILYIMNEVNFGWLIRSIHGWSANLMLTTCVLHLLRVFFQAAYQKPREITWMAGVVLLLISLGFGFTGYLLPWDQRAFWATTVGTQIAGSVPVVGELLQQFLRNGSDVSGLTLTRFYGIHTLVLPVSIALFVLIHLGLIHAQGLATPPRVRDQGEKHE